MSTDTIDVSNLTTEQLQQLLEKKKKQEAEKERRKRQEYERERDHMVKNMVIEAQILHSIMDSFKHKCMRKLENFSEKAQEYGQIRKHSKGGFSLRTADGDMMVSYDRNTVPEYDERAHMAEDLLKEFLEDKVKKRDQKTFRTITALMSRNKEGRFFPSRINALLKIRDNYDDERWQRAMKLFEESYRNRLVSYTVTFYVKDHMEKDRSIPLTFASLPYDPNREDLDFDMKSLQIEMQEA